MNETNSTIKNILLIGAAGGLAKITTKILQKCYPNSKIIGIDNRNTKRLPLHKNIEYRTIKYTRGNFEKLFRELKFDAVIHLSRLSHATNLLKDNLSERLDLNIMGTQRILDLCLKFHVKKVIVLSTFHVYGAVHDNPVYLKEEAPLKAGLIYPEIRDVTEMDQLCSNWMWKNHGKIECIVLRPCNILGPQINNTISKYLTTSYAPLPIDFNPMFQFIHEHDMANVLVRCLGDIPSGVYNVAPNETISLREAKKYLKFPTLKVPIFALKQFAGVLKKFWSFPDYLIEYIMYSCIIDSSAMNKLLGDDFYDYNTYEILDHLKND